MRDRFFYPLALIVVAVIIGLALLPGRGKAQLNDAEIIANGYLLSGNDLVKMTASPSTVVEFSKNDQGDVSMAILSSIMPKDRAPLSAGVFGTLGSNYERIFGGQQLEITVRARAGKTNPLDRFEIAYFTASVGDSSWKEFELGPEFEDYSFKFTPNRPQGDPGIDYVGMWPGKKGRSETMEVESISVKISTP